MDEDFIMMRKIKAGDVNAMSSFVKKYYSDIYRYCYRKVLEKETAEDITQEVFLNFCNHLESYTHRGKSKNYLYVIAGNLCKNHHRKRQMEYLEDLDTELQCNERYNQIENQISLEQALLRLPKEQREVLLLHYFQDLKLREVAQIMGTTLSLVKYRLARGIKKWGEILNKEDWME